MKLLFLVIGFAAVTYAQTRPKIICDFGRTREFVDEVGVDVSSEIPYFRRTRCRVILKFPENEGFSISCPRMQIDNRGRCRKARLIFVERFNLRFWDRICDNRADGYQLERAGTPGVAYRLVINFRTARRRLSRNPERGFDCTIRAVKNITGSSSTANPAPASSTPIVINSTPMTFSSTEAPINGSSSPSPVANSTPLVVSSTQVPVNGSSSSSIAATSSPVVVSSTQVPVNGSSSTSAPASNITVVVSSTQVPVNGSSSTSAPANNSTVVVSSTQVPVNGSSSSSAPASNSTVASTPATPTTLPASNASGANCQCGVKGNNRIVGGMNAERHEFPWQATLAFSFNGSYYRGCGGTLITDRHVLTAAHCVQFAPVGSFIMAFGDYNTTANSDLILRNVSRITIHPQYNKTSFLDNDFAIVELTEPVPIENPIYTPACLPSDLSQSFEGRIATVTGFGALRENGTTPLILQEVQVPVVSNGVCNGPYRGGITDNMMCAGLPEGGKDACQGDSGGPLVVETSPNSGKYQIAGVVSFGAGCARPGLYGVYARVTAQDSWIRGLITSGTMCRN